MKRATHRSHRFSLDPVVGENAVDPRTYLVLARASLGTTAARELERRLLELHLAGHTTLIVQLAQAARVSGPMIAALRRARRSLENRNGRLLVSVAEPETRHVLECAGLDVVDLDQVTAQSEHSGENY